MSSGNDNNTLFEGIQKAFKKDQYEECKKACLAYNDGGTTNVRVLWYLAESYRMLGNAPKAIETATQCLQLDKSFIKAYHTRGEAYRANKDVNSALKDFRSATKLNPTSVSLLSSLASLLREQSNVDECIEVYNKMISLDPRSKFFFYRAECYRAKGLVDEAIADFRETLKLFPGSAKTLRHLAELNLLVGDYEHAIDCCNKGLKMSDSKEKFYGIRANGYRLSCQYELGLEDIDRALDLEPSMAKYHFIKADLLRLNGDIGGALRSANISLSLEKTNVDALYVRAVANMALGRHNEAIGDSVEGLSLTTKDADFYYVMAETLRQKGDFENSIEQATVGLGLDEEDPLLLATRGSSYRFVSANKQARQDLKKAQKIVAGYMFAKKEMEKI